MIHTLKFLAYPRAPMRVTVMFSPLTSKALKSYFNLRTAVYCKVNSVSTHTKNICAQYNRGHTSNVFQEMPIIVGRGPIQYISTIQ